MTFFLCAFFLFLMQSWPALDDKHNEKEKFYNDIGSWMTSMAVQHVSKRHTSLIKHELQKWEDVGTKVKWLFYNECKRKHQLIMTLKAARCNVKDVTMVKKMEAKIGMLKKEILENARMGPPNGGIVLGTVDLSPIDSTGIVFVKILSMSGGLLLPVVVIMGGLAIACTPYVMNNGQLLRDDMETYQRRLNDAITGERLAQAMALCKKLREERIKGTGRMCHVYYTCMAISQHWVQFLCDGVYDV